MTQRIDTAKTSRELVWYEVTDTDHHTHRNKKRTLTRPDKHFDNKHFDNKNKHFDNKNKNFDNKN